MHIHIEVHGTFPYVCIYVQMYTYGHIHMWTYQYISTFILFILRQPDRATIITSRKAAPGSGAHPQLLALHIAESYSSAGNWQRQAGGSETPLLPSKYCTTSGISASFQTSPHSTVEKTSNPDCLRKSEGNTAHGSRSLHNLRKRRRTLRPNRGG